MNRERWVRLQDLFLAASTLPAGEQRAFLEANCGTDLELLADALGMLEEQESTRALLKADLTTFAALAFEGEQDPYLDRTFGAYHFKRRLAEGGMSSVYLAERPDYDGTVAVKVLRDALSPERKQLFDYEKRLLAQMNHPSISRLYDAGTLDDGASFFAMEYVDGLPVTEYCRRHKLQLADRLAIFRQVCEATRYAHERGIIHRDLKPSNILVQAAGVVKLLDFGVSERTGDPRGAVQSSSYMTLAYAAPEQIRHEATDVRADIYSLGVILQQLLTGQLPFDLAGKTLQETRRIVLTQSPRKPSARRREQGSLQAPITPATDPHLELGLDPGIDPKALSCMDWQDIDHICGTALAKDAAARYSSVESLARDLDRFMEKRPLEGRRKSHRYVAARFLQRNRRSAVITSLIAFCVVGLIAFYTFRLTQARNAALAEVARTGRVEKFMERLLTGDDPNNGPSLDLRVVTILERGVRDAQALNNDPPIQAELYETLGGIYGVMGNFERAEPLFQAALEEQTRLYGAESAQVAETMAGLGLTRLNEGKPKDAEKIVTEAIAIDRRKLPASHPQANEASISLGQILIDRGAYTDAIPILEKAIRIESERDGHPYDLSAALSNLANAYFYLGRLDDSEKLVLRAIEMDRKLKGEENIDIAEDLMTLAELDERRGRLAKAETEERRALAIEQHWYQNEDQAELASAMTILAQTLAKEGKYQDAEPVVEGALSMRVRLHTPVNGGFAHTWNAMGQIDEKLGKLDKAAEDHARALEMYRQLFPGFSYQAGVCFDNLSAVSFQRKQYEQAGQYSRQALEQLTAKLPPNDVKIATAETHYGRSLVAERRLDEAEKQYLAAYAILEQQEGHETEMKALRALLVTLYQLEQKPDKALTYQALS